MDMFGNLVTNSFISSLARSDAVSRVNTSPDSPTQANNAEFKENPDYQINPIDQITEILRDGNDSTTLLQTAEQGLTSLAENIASLRQMALTAADEDSTDEERISLNEQAGELIQNLREDINSVSYNNANILDQAPEAIVLDITANESGNIELGILNIDSSFVESGIDNINLNSQENAEASLEIIENLSQDVSSARNRNAESSARLASYIDTLSIEQVDAWEALSPVQDAQISETVSSLLTDQLKRNSSVFLEVQANTTRRAVLGLLKV